MGIKIDKTRCVACGLCIELCPRRAISVSRNKSAIDPEKCDFCKYCLNLCICGAISEESMEDKR